MHPRLATEQLPVSIGIKNDRAAKGVALGPVSYDEVVACEYKRGRLQSELRDCVFPRSQGSVLVECDATWYVSASVMRVDADAILDRMCSAGRDFDAHIENTAWPAKIVQGDDVAAVNVLNRIERQIQRGSRTGSACFHIAAVRLDVADPRCLPGRLNDDCLTAAQRAAVQGAGDHRADSLQLENSIDR